MMKQKINEKTKIVIKALSEVIGEEKNKLKEDLKNVELTEASLEFKVSYPEIINTQQ